MISAAKAREWLDLLGETPPWLAREAVVEALQTVIVQAEQIERVRALLKGNSSYLVHAESLRAAPGGEPESHSFTPPQGVTDYGCAQCGKEWLQHPEAKR